MEDNVYYSPERFGLEVVAMISYCNTTYQYDIRVVWREDTTGIPYTARDRGWSCPTPFDRYDTVADLERFYLSDIEKEVYQEQSGRQIKKDRRGSSMIESESEGLFIDSDTVPS